MGTVPNFVLTLVNKPSLRLTIRCGRRAPRMATNPLKCIRGISAEFPVALHDRNGPPHLLTEGLQGGVQHKRSDDEKPHAAHYGVAPKA